MHKLAISAGILLLLTAFFFSCNTAPAAPEPAPITKDSLIKKGAYLVLTMGCNDCHSPKRLGPNGPELIDSLLLSGHPANIPVTPVKDSNLTKQWVLFFPDLTACIGPWGTSFSANITSDATGIGSWTLDRFRKAFQEGKYHGLENTRPIVPPMPIATYKYTKPDDVEAIFTYLQSTKPVKNLVPQYIPPSPQNH
jgi:hypothetical protein